MTEIYLSPSGDDTADGRRSSPLRSPATALAKAVAGSRIIFLPGVYPLEKPLVLGPEHRGLHLCADTPGSAILDGGRVVHGWTERVANGRRRWEVRLEDTASGRWYFRQLFVNGRRAPRARLPKFGPGEEERNNLFRIAELRNLDPTNKMTGGDFQFRPAPGDIQAWESLYDAEIVIPHFWLEERMTQPRLNPRTGWVESARRSAFVLTEAFGPETAPYYIDNLREALTDPGEWYLDKDTGILAYLPLPDEKRESTTVIAPRLHQLLQLEGRGYNHTKQWGDPAMETHAGMGVRIEGLVFRHADWQQPNPSFEKNDRIPPPVRPLAACGQSACDVGGAISLTLTRGVEFRDCTIEHVGGYGLVISEGCRDIGVHGCLFRDLGAGGIRLNGAERDAAPGRLTGYCSITDNTISGGGRVFHSGVGILAMNTLENVIAHNEINDLFYSGISVGWSWGYKETVSRDNLILHNHVHHVGQGLLSDLGAIYLLGVQPGTLIAGNHVHHVAKRHYGSIGIYLDEGASHVVVENNLVHDIEGACANVHFGRENIFRNNMFIVLEDRVGATIGKTENHTAATFHHNRFLLGKGSAAYGGGYAGDARRSFRCLENTMETPQGTPPPVWLDGWGERPVSWDDWQASGNDRHTEVRKRSCGSDASDLTWPGTGPRPQHSRTPLRQPMTREDRRPA